MSALPPRVHKSPPQNTNITLRHSHPLIQTKVCQLGRRRPTQSRINRLAQQTMKKSSFQAQSVQTVLAHPRH